MEMIVTRGGEVRCLYDELIDLNALGRPTITRASHVEPDAEGRWWADLAPGGGPRIGPFLGAVGGVGGGAGVAGKALVDARSGWQPTTRVARRPGRHPGRVTARARCAEPLPQPAGYRGGGFLHRTRLPQPDTHTGGRKCFRSGPPSPDRAQVRLSTLWTS